MIIGIDSGSTETKGVMFMNKKLINKKMVKTGGHPKESIDKVLHELNPNKENALIVTTGYGRNLYEEADFSLTEISCHAKGARFIEPEIMNVIDIGGQDSKVISMDENGMVNDFLMNDRCAAGTGRFIEMMLEFFQKTPEELEKFVKGAEPVKINSMCAIFAESEVIGMVAKGEKQSDIMSGVLHSVAERISKQYERLSSDEGNDILFTGGVAQSSVFTEVLQEYLPNKIITSPLSQYAGAIGAAISKS